MPLVFSFLSFIVGFFGSVIAVAFTNARASLRPQTRRDKAHPLDYGLDAQHVRFPSADGTLLAGWFVPGKLPATVLLCHGYADTKATMLPYARFLNRRGFSVLLFDFRSHGESEGDGITLGYKEQRDIEGALAYLKGRQDGGRRFGALGLSLGAVSALLAAVENPDIAAVVADSGYRSLHSATAQHFVHLTGIPVFPFGFVANIFHMLTLGINRSLISPETKIATISPRAVFFIHGKQDTLVNPKDSEELYALAGEPKMLWMVPGAEHVQAYAAAAGEYEGRVCDFFCSHLLPQGRGGIGISPAAETDPP